MKTSRRKINRITKKAYPLLIYSRNECKVLRESLCNDILEYIEKHPDTTTADLEQHFLEDNARSNKELQFSRLFKLACLSGIILILLCVLIFFIASTWTPPVYYI